MRIFIISDLHANLEALESLPRDYDELWVLGDLVNYGPNPAEVIDWVRSLASVVVRGNHDHSVGYGQDPRCSVRFRRMAEETRQFTLSALNDSQKQYLRGLPTTAARDVNGVRFFLCHATPSAPLFEYRKPDSPQWAQEVSGFPADMLLVGHTHLPFEIKFGKRRVLNPGSLGQPKHGRPEACYALWDGYSMQLRSLAYPVEETIRKIGSLPVSRQVYEDLAVVLRTGGALSGS
jgi:putative phosphoesterase